MSSTPNTQHAPHAHKGAHHPHDGAAEHPASELPAPEGIRGNIYAALFDPNRPGNLQPFIDNFTMALIVAIPFALLFENVPEVYEANKDLFHFFDMFSLAVFTIEYVLRLYTAPEMAEFKGKPLSHFRWMFMPMSLIDLAAILPFYLSLLPAQRWCAAGNPTTALGQALAHPDSCDAGICPT